MGGARRGSGGAVAEEVEVMVIDRVLSLQPEDPALVGGYRLRGRLGEGGMGVVYLAGKPGDQVAIKTSGWHTRRWARWRRPKTAFRRHGSGSAALRIPGRSATCAAG